MHEDQRGENHNPVAGTADHHADGSHFRLDLHPIRRNSEDPNTSAADFFQPPPTHASLAAPAAPPPSVLFGERTRRALCYSAVCLFVLLWILWGVFKSALWRDSVRVSVGLSRHGGFLFVYSWIFSQVFFMWYPVILGLLLFLSPRKESALTACYTFMASYFVRQYLRLAIRESRPQYDSADIVMRGGCNCSFGMPSGHSEGSAMIYALLLHETVFQSARLSRCHKAAWLGLGVFVVLSVLFSRVYFGRHSLPQVVIGGWMGLTAFSLMLLFKKQLDSFFLKVANGDRPKQWLLLLVSGAPVALNIVLWFAVFNRSIEHSGIAPLTCLHCFENRAREIKVDLSRALCYPAAGFGMSLGFLLLRTRLHCGDKLSPNRWLSKISVMRFCLMAALHAPLLAVLLLRIPPGAIVVVSSLLYILTGLLITAGFIFVTGRCGLTVEGDILPMPRIEQPGNPQSHFVYVNN